MLFCYYKAMEEKKKKSIKDFLSAGNPIFKFVEAPVKFFKGALQTIFGDDALIKGFLEGSGLKKKENYEKENYELLKQINEKIREK